MAARLLFPQFRDEQSDSKYPFVDGATFAPRAAAAQIDKSAFRSIIDAVFYPIGGGHRLYLASVTVDELFIRFVVVDFDGVVSISAVYDWRNPPTNNTLNFFDQYDRPAGAIIAETTDLDRFRGWGVGQYDFLPSATEFVATVVIPAKEPGVRLLQNENNAVFFGDVWLIGDAGIVLRAETSNDDDTNVIRIDIVGEPLFQRYVCANADSVFQPKKFVRTINGCPPDEYGNFTITATEKLLTNGKNDVPLRVYPETGSIFIAALNRGTT